MTAGNGNNRMSSSGTNRSNSRRQASNANSMTRQIAQGKTTRQIQTERARQARAQQARLEQSAEASYSSQARPSSSASSWSRSSRNTQTGRTGAAKGRPPGVPPRKRKGHRPGILSWLLALAAICGLGWFLYQLIRINILPGTMLVTLCGILVFILFLLILVWLFKTRRKATRIVMGCLVCFIGIACGLGGYYLQSTDTMFEQVTNLTDKQANVLTVYAMKETDITKPDQLKSGMTVGIDPSDDSEGTQQTIEQLKKDGAVFETVTFDNCYTLVDALYDHDVDAIIFPENVHAELYEQANDDNKYNALTTFTNVVAQHVYYTERDQNTVNRPDPVSNIMLDPFTVLVSGNDSYGSINQVTRSDVNMLVTVNPRTAQVLILSIPRDSYMEITCKKNQNACAAVAGEPDKLTHSGLYGVGSTESTLEDAFDVEVNYYVRINFSSLINIIDAIGGIDVNVEPGLEVERFYANGTEGVHAGMNHLEGERALAFVRERHAYEDGDNQRIKNQQIVLRALLKALLSPKMVVNYPKVMTALSTAFDTNMTSNEIKSLLTLELSRFPKWNIQSYALAGDSVMEYSPSAQTDLSVMMLSQQSVAQAKALIDDVIAGRTLNLDSGEAPAVSTEITDEPSTYESSDPYSVEEDPYSQDLSSESDESLYSDLYDDPYQDPYSSEDSDESESSSRHSLYTSRYPNSEEEDLSEDDGYGYYEPSLYTPYPNGGTSHDTSDYGSAPAYGEGYFE